ncbi:ATP-binding protein [Ruegeria sp. 2205SS24-7]|uniref:ATP-binding protein n=1 Tax=Ruegeria discodermiae TaxID=3064389 RepID=UPI0027410DCA|nr:ATP-binding protein [Ruegeria sp. 2205SS24-7]MDP5220050.1 ATP-binding protein [Ruegeria sp. 2205SS24-7]
MTPLSQVTSRRPTFAKKTDPGAGRAAGPVVDVGTFHGRDIHVHLGVDTVPVSFRRRIKRFVDGYLGSAAMPVAFGGRATEIAELNQWFRDPEASSHLLVAAEAGRGKTALLVRWLEQLEDDVQLAFVPISIRYETSRPSVFFQAFAGRLAYLLGQQLPTATSDPTEFYKEKLIEYLEAMEDRGTPCLIVIDGLDEATGWRFDADFLPDCMGSNLKVLVSARILAGDQGEEGWLRRLDWDVPGASVETLRIPPLNAVGIADVLRQTDPVLVHLAVDEELIAELNRLTQGDPLLLTYYVDDFRQSLKSGEGEPPKLSDSDAGFGPYFDRWLDRQGGIYQDTGAAFDEQVIKAILAILACAIGPLPLRDLAVLVERLTDDRHILAKDTVDPLQRFIVGDGLELGYALGHPKLRNYIRAEYFGGSDIVARAEQVFVDWGRHQIAALAAGDIAAAAMPAYLLQFHAQHLEVCRAPIDAYSELLSTAWRTAWEADRQSEGYLGLSNDVDVAKKAMANALETADDGERPVLWSELFAGALISSSIQSLSLGIPPALLAKALEHGVLAVGSALHFAERRAPAGRLKAIAAVAEALPESRRRTVLEDALASISTLAKENDQASALADLAPYLPDDLLSEALELALDLNSELALQTALAGLIPVLPQADQDRVLEAAEARMSSSRLFELISELAPHLYEQKLQKLISMAKKGSNLHDRAHAFRNIAHALNADDQQALADEALQPIRTSDHSRIDWTDVHRALAPLQASIRGPAISEIASLTSKRFAEDVETMMELLADPEYGFYGQYFDEEQQREEAEGRVRQHYILAAAKLTDAAEESSAEAVFQLAQAIMKPSQIFLCSTALIERCAPDQRKHFLDIALSLAELPELHELPGFNRIEALTSLARHLNGSEAERILQNAYHSAQGLAPAELARNISFLPREMRSSLVPDVLQKLEKSPFLVDREEALASVSVHLDSETVEDALRVATRVSTGDDIAPMIHSAAPNLSPSNIHHAFEKTLTFSTHERLGCLQALGGFLSEPDAKVALQRLNEKDLAYGSSLAQAAVLGALPACFRQSYMEDRLSVWRAQIMEESGEFNAEFVLNMLPCLSADQRFELLDLLLEHPKRRTEDLVASLIDKKYVEKSGAAKSKIRDYLQEVDTTNALNLTRRLREVFEEETPSVLPEILVGVRGFYDLPRHYALGRGATDPKIEDETRRFAKKLRADTLAESEDLWTQWREWTDVLQALPPEDATLQANYLGAYMRAIVQPDDPAVPEPGGENACRLLAAQVASLAQFGAIYLSDAELDALLDYHALGFDNERIRGAVFSASTGPVLERAIAMLPSDFLAHLSRAELSNALKNKTTEEVRQIYELWRADQPDAAQTTLLPFLRHFEPDEVMAIVEEVENTSPRAFIDCFTDLIKLVSDAALPGLISRALEAISDTVELSVLRQLILSAGGKNLSKLTEIYMRRLGTLTRTQVMDEISTLVADMADTMTQPQASTDLIYDRVATALQEWQ